MTDGMGKNGREIKRQYAAMETGPKGGKTGVTQRESGVQTGSGSHIWQVKVAVMNPAEWPYLCSVVVSVVL